MVTPLRSRKNVETETEMAESEEIQMVVMQVAIQAVRAAVMAIREADVGTVLGTNAGSLGEITDTAKTDQP